MAKTRFQKECEEIKKMHETPAQMVKIDFAALHKEMLEEWIKTYLGRGFTQKESEILAKKQMLMQE